MKEWTRRTLARAIIRHQSNPLDTVMIVIIVLAGVVAGLETFPAIMDTYAYVFHAIDIVFVLLFAVEAGVKIGLHAPRPWRYFVNGWNIFDFLILILTSIPIIIGADHTAVEAAMALRSLRIIRSLRALRLLRLTSELRGMRIVIETLMRSLPQLSIVALMLVSLVYTYAVIGYNLFHYNDPKHFGSLWASILSMFQCAVGDFAEIMHRQIDGSDFDPAYFESIKQMYPNVVPETFPVIAPIFFISFVFIAGLTILNFFVGTIIAELDNVREEEHSQSSNISKLQRRFDRLESMLMVIEQRTAKSENQSVNGE